MIKIFIYGTLLKGQAREYILESSVFLGNAETKEEYSLFDLGRFPGVSQEGTGVVKGELYGVDEETLKYLDQIEGHPKFFFRKQIKLSDDQTAWIYFKPESMEGILIESGDYNRYTKKEKTA